MSDPVPKSAGDGATLTPARTADIDAFVAIDSGSPQPWTCSAFETELGNTPPTLFALRRESDVIGFVVARFHPPEMDIVNLGVAEGRRRLGYGGLLLRLLLERARLAGVERAFLEVREGNTKALRLYLRSGFKEVQRRKNFYSNPVEDAILMGLKIEP